MQTLIFNTKEKTTKLFENISDGKPISEFSFSNVSTVQVRDTGFYEIMKSDGEKSVPVGRLPISNTNMIIEK